MLLLTENIAGLVYVEMLPNCNYQSVLSFRFSGSEYLCKDGRKIKLTFYIHAFHALQSYDRWVADLLFLGISVAINLLILC